MSARAVVAWGAGVTAILTAVSGALINQLDGGWRWWVAAGAVVLISAALTALTAWLASRPSDGPPAGGAGDRLAPGAVKTGRDIRGDVTINIGVGIDAGQPPTAAPVTATPWSRGPGAAIEAGRDINGPVHVTIINGTFDLLNNAIFDPGPLESALDLAHFTGRKWLIDRIDAYIAKEPCGYVVVEAEAGVGKSALAAHLVWTRPCAYHFTRLAGGQSPVEARRSLAAQLIGAWQLHDLAPGDAFPAGAGRPDWLLKVLQAAATRRDATRPGQPLVLIVDGLDEADPPVPGHDTGTGIPLGLPRPEHLPRGVFIVATSRFGTRLPALYGPVARYPITVKGRTENLADMRQFVTNAVTGVSPQQRLVDILAAHHVDPQTFVESLLERCGGVWVHLRYMLNDILAERLEPADVHRLPGDLVGYYREQVGRWRDAEGWQHLGLPVVATLVALRRSADRDNIADLANVPAGEPLERWLEEGLRPFLDVTRGPRDRSLYAIQHESLRELFAPSGKFDERDGTRETLHEALLAAHRRITAALIPTGLPAERDWKTVDEYTRVSLAEHAAHSGRLDELACDPGFLLVCDPASLLRHRASVTTDDARAAIAAYELVLDQWARCNSDKRLWWLYVWAHKTRSHSLADRTAAYHHSDWQVVTAMWTGSSHRTLTGHTKQVSTVCALPLLKRTLLASAGHDGVVRLWDPDPNAGKQVGQLIGYTKLVNALCPLTLTDGSRVLVSGGVDGTVRLWDPSSGELAEPPLTGHTGAVSAVCALRLPDDGGSVLASASLDGTVRLWDPDAGAQVGQLIGYAELVNALCPLTLTDGSRVLVSGGVDGTVRLWDPDSGKQVGRSLEGHTSAVSAVCALRLPDDGGSVLASASLDGTVRLWDPDSEERVDLRLTGHIDIDGVRAVCAVQLLDGRSLLASAGRDRVLRLWNPAGGAQVGQPLAGHTDEVSAVCALTLPDRRGLLASAGRDRVLRLWDQDAGAQVGQPLAGHSDEVSAVCAVPLPDGRTLLASAGHDRVLRLWDPHAGAQVGQPLAGHTEGVSAVCAVPLPGGRNVLASGGVDGTVRLWDPDSGKQVGPPLAGHTKRVTAVCALTLPDGRGSVLASASLDRTVRLWNPDGSKHVDRPLAGHTDWVSAVCAVVLPDGRTLLASAGFDQVLRLWDPDSGEQVGAALEGHTEGVTAVCPVSLPDGRTLLASAGHQVLRLWDPDSGKQVGPPLAGHPEGVSAVCAVPLPEGGNVLASGGVDGTVRLWDPDSGKQVGPPLEGHTDRVTAVCPLPGPEGHTLMATAGKDRTVFVWDLSGLVWAADQIAHGHGG